MFLCGSAAGGGVWLETSRKIRKTSSFTFCQRLQDGFLCGLYNLVQKTEYTAVWDISEEFEPKTIGIISWRNLMLIENDKVQKAWVTNQFSELEE
jgi:hypothetical protein